MATTRVLALDSETRLMASACMAPDLVCITWQFDDEPSPHIAHWSTALPLLKEWFRDPNVLIVGHNFAFDAGVFCEAFPELRKDIFAAYKANRVTDTMIRAWLLDTAAGKFRGTVTAKGKKIPRKYDLESLAKNNAGIILQKDAWRLSYGEFFDTPLGEWAARALVVQEAARPRLEALQAEASKAKGEALKALKKQITPLFDMVNSDPRRCLDYALEDARATLAVYKAQARHAPYLDDQFRQARAYFALNLSACWGLRTDPKDLDTLEQAIRAEFEDVDQLLKDAGLVKPNGVKNTKAAKKRMISLAKAGASILVRTDKHFAKRPDGTPKCDKGDACEDCVALDAETCDDTEDELLISYAQHATLKKQLRNDMVAMRHGVTVPLHTSYKFAATGRTTSSSPKIVPGTNVQNISTRDGFREIFVPRKGHVFFDVDYPTLELYTWAQCCMSWLGFSKMAEALNSGMDPHLWFAAVIMQKDYEWALERIDDPYVKKIRRQAKPCNFGFPGGMGAETFLLTQRKQLGRKAFEELGLTLELVTRMKDQWFEAWPEAKPYFARTNSMLRDNGRANPVTLWTNRQRGNATYCQTNNAGFQALGADCAKNAAWLIAEAQYVVKESPLYNTRTVAFVHDQFLGECVNDHRAHDAAYECARLMCEGANVYLPDVPIPMKKMAPALSYRWSKHAAPVFGSDGRLVPWTPKARAA